MHAIDAQRTGLFAAGSVGSVLGVLPGGLIDVVHPGIRATGAAVQL